MCELCEITQFWNHIWSNANWVNESCLGSIVISIIAVHKNAMIHYACKISVRLPFTQAVRVRIKQLSWWSVELSAVQSMLVYTQHNHSVQWQRLCTWLGTMNFTHLGPLGPIVPIDVVWHHYWFSWHQLILTDGDWAFIYTEACMW